MSEHNPDLARRLERGEYVIDAEAIAEAIVRRGTSDWFLGSRLAEMLETDDPDRVPRSIEKQRARSRPDFS